MKRTSLVVLVAGLLFASVADADEPTESAPIAVPDANASWWARYRAARKKMEEGQFADAAGDFDALATSAPDAATSAFVREDARICHAWASKNLALARQADLAESTAHARELNVRTTDELAVLYTNAVFYGIGTGAWLAVQTKPNSAAGGVLPALGLAGAAALGVYALDSGKPLGYGVPQSIVSGMYLGLLEGVAWTLWNQYRHTYYDSWSGEQVSTVIWGSASVGAIAGGVIGSMAGTTPGRASFVGSAGLWSSAVAGLLTLGVHPDNDGQDDHSFLAAALGLNAGAIAGALVAGDVSPSIARVRFLDLGGIAGFLLGSGLYLAAEPDSGSAFGLMTGIGIAGGLGVAWAATAKMPKDTNSVASALPAMALAPERGGAKFTVAMAF